MALVLLAPVLFLLLIEGLLALTGWVEPVRLLNRVEHQGQVYWAANAHYGQFLFQREGAPTPSEVWVPTEKPAGQRRVVLLGASTAHGFPLNIMNLARVSDAWWARAYPDEPVRVIGLTMTGINSHVLRLFADEAFKLEPDLLVMYAGHNEVIGPYGPASVFGRAGVPLWLIRAQLWLSRTRVAQAAQSLIASLLPAESPAAWQGLSAFAETPIAADDPRLAVMRGRTERNLRAMLRQAEKRGVPIVLAAPAMNLNDWPPLGSLPDEVTDEDALRLVRAGQADQLTSASQLYRLGQLFERRGDLDQAWPLYRKAVDADTLRFRFDGPLKTIYDRLAAEFAGPGFVYADIDRLLHEDDASFSSDRLFFVEHVHLTVEGRLRIAEALVGAMADAFGLPDVARPVTADEVLRDLFWTELHEVDLLSKTVSLLVDPPFAQQPGNAERVASMRARIEQLQDQFRETWNGDRVFEVYRKSVGQRPYDPMQYVVAGRLYSFLGQTISAEAALRQALDVHPRQTDALFNIIKLMMGRDAHEDALEAALRLVEFAPADPEMLQLIGELYNLCQQPEAAVAHLTSALQRRPEDPVLLYHLGVGLHMQGQVDEAVAALRRALQRMPDSVEILFTLSWMLATESSLAADRQTAALGYAERALRQAPDDSRSLAAHALALAANGQHARARQQAQRALEAFRRGGEQGMENELNHAMEQLGVPLR
jgi:tetratricopeptide (TPR) repeat protein